MILRRRRPCRSGPDLHGGPVGSNDTGQPVPPHQSNARRGFFSVSRVGSVRIWTGLPLRPSSRWPRSLLCTPGRGRNSGCVRAASTGTQPKGGAVAPALVAAPPTSIPRPNASGIAIGRGKAAHSHARAAPRRRGLAERPRRLLSSSSRPSRSPAAWSAPARGFLAEGPAPG